jgi:hypothetical protein
MRAFLGDLPLGLAELSPQLFPFFVSGDRGRLGAALRNAEPSLEQFLKPSPEHRWL